jgi:hypothetical protein
MNMNLSADDYLDLTLGIAVVLAAISFISVLTRQYLLSGDRRIAQAKETTRDGMRRGNPVEPAFGTTEKTVENNASISKRSSFPLLPRLHGHGPRLITGLPIAWKYLRSGLSKSLPEIVFPHLSIWQGYDQDKVVVEERPTHPLQPKSFEAELIRAQVAVTSLTQSLVNEGYIDYIDIDEVNKEMLTSGSQ